MRKTLVSLTTLVAAMLFATASYAGPFGNIKPGGSGLSHSSGALSKNATKATPANKYTPPVSSKALDPKPVPYTPPPNNKALDPSKGPVVVGPKAPKPPGTVPMPPPSAPMPPGPVADKGGHGHHHPHGNPYLGLGLFGAGIAVAAAPTVVEYVQQPVAVQQAYAPAPSPYAPAQALAAPAMENPFDAFVGRLNGLTMAMQQGLITRDEYRMQRQAVMASLDAGQVSRTIGVQDGLRQLRTMADGGALTPREYDDKRKEFVLFL